MTQQYELDDGPLTNGQLDLITARSGVGKSVVFDQHLFNNLVDENGNPIVVEVEYADEQERQKHLSKLKSVGERAAAFGTRCKELLDGADHGQTSINS